MEITIIILTVSLITNVYLVYLYKKKPQKQETYDTTELLQDLLVGNALVKVTRVAPVDVILRSPRK